jgi:hypothetical protein
MIISPQMLLLLSFYRISSYYDSNYHCFIMSISMPALFLFSYLLHLSYPSFSCPILLTDFNIVATNLAFNGLSRIPMSSYLFWTPSIGGPLGINFISLFCVMLSHRFEPLIVESTFRICLWPITAFAVLSFPANLKCS